MYEGINFLGERVLISTNPILENVYKYLCFISHDI